MGKILKTVQYPLLSEREKKSHAVSDRLATLNEMCDKMLKWMRRRRGERLSVQQRGVSLQMR